jgi:hypothetical protein
MLKKLNVKSIYDNVAWGAKVNGYKGNMSDPENRGIENY